MLFGTTDEFLKRFQLESLDELPDYETLLESIKVIGEKNDESRSIYNEYEIPDEETSEELPAEEDVPDFLKDEKDIQKVDGESA